MALHAFSSAMALDPIITNGHSIMIGFQNFLDRHTGDVTDAGDGLFCINTSDVLMNNLHYEVALSGYMPNGTSTTEGQALLIQGYICLYQATKDPFYLAQARRFFNAYFKYFYRDTPIPNTPQVWRCHWAINGKAPFRTFGPVNFQDPSASGAWDVPVDFVNGVGYVPAGTPYYGEQVTRVYHVYVGKMSWDNVTADPATGGYRVPMAWFVDDRGLRLTEDGDELDETPTGEPTRKIMLEDATFNGTLNISFACRSGLIIDRNVPFEGWPMWQHVEKAYYGNSGDSEEWFCEALWWMFQETQEQKYLRAYNACSYTLWNMANLGPQNVMFIRDTTHSTTTPFTEGISYWWNVTDNADALCVRDPTNGYIRFEKTEELYIEDVSQVAVEQMALINKVDNNSYIHMEFGINIDPAAVPFAKMNMFSRVSDSLVPDTGRVWRHPVFSNNSVTPEIRNYWLQNMMAFTQTNGREYVMLTGQSFVAFGEAASGGGVGYGILGDARRNDYIGTLEVRDASSGVVLGFWGADPNTQPLMALTYKYNGTGGALAVNVTDAAGWKWEYTLPGAGTTDWRTENLSWGALRLMNNQNNTGTRPTAPAQRDNLTQITIGLPDGSDTAGSMQTYCYGAVPEFFNGSGYMNHWKFMIVDHYDFVANMGEVSIQQTQELRAKYTPGVIPFSTNYSQKKGKIEYYHGTPYTGYVYAIQWLLSGKMEAVNNCIEYWHDAQADYFNRTGLLGPLAPVYVWPRWDNVSYGDPETFAYVEWGYHLPWAGYYSRTIFSATHLWEMMVKMGYPVPQKLIDVCEKWMTYLANFMDANDDNTPTVFPKPGDGPPYNDGYDPDPEISRPDHTGHMTAHFLCSAIFMKMSGSTHPRLERIITGCIREFERTYYVSQGTTEHMSGAYTSYAGGNYFYGFWAGEIMRAFATLMQYRDWVGRQPPGLVEDNLWRIALESGANMLTQAGGLFLYNNPVYFNSMIMPMLLEDGASIKLQVGEGFLCTEPD